MPATGVTFINSNELTAISPAATGVLDVRVTTNGRTSASSTADTFTYVPAAVVPIVTSIQPTTGPVAGNTNVTINGTGFDPGSTVTFSDQWGDFQDAPNVTYVNGNQLIATSPPGDIFFDVVDVQVTNALGNTSPTSATDQFNYLTPGQPNVTSITPTTGPVAGNTNVTINGTGFDPGSTVTFTDWWGDASNATSVTYVNGNQLDRDLPARRYFLWLRGRASDHCGGKHLHRLRCRPV